MPSIGEFECTESYFGAKRVRGKRGRGAVGKTPVFGLLKRGEKVCMRVVENYSRESLMPIIQGLTQSGSTIYTDGWKAYDGLILNGYEHHRISLKTTLRIPP
ncbi:MAG: transposase [Treponema sp.]|nr:transposase [Treponema sp.]